MSNAHAEQWKKSQKTLKHLKHIVKSYNKPEHILNIITKMPRSEKKTFFVLAH